MQLVGRVLAGEERENARATVTRPPKRVTVAIIFLERLMARLLLAGNGGLALHLDFAGVIERQLEMVTWWWWWLFFPSSIDEQIICRPAISDLEKQLADQSNRFLNLQEMVDDLASKHAYNPDEDYMEVEAKLRGHLESFLETARSFNTIYTKGIRPWTHMMEVPQLHGFGPAANRLLEAYKMLLKFLGNLRNLRDAHAAVAVGSSETIAGEPSSISRIIISECESALTFLNRDVGILSASIAREQGEEVNL